MFWDVRRQVVLSTLIALSGLPALGQTMKPGDAPVELEDVEPSPQPTGNTVNLIRTSSLWQWEVPILLALSQAIDDGDPDALQAALTDLKCVPECGRVLAELPVLSRAAAIGNVAIVSQLLDAGADIDQRSGPVGWTPLLEALFALNVDVAKLLIEAGADSTIAGSDGTVAPYLADLAGVGDLIPYPPLQMTYGEANKLLLRAAEAGSVDAMRLSLAAGAHLQVTAPNGWSPLMIAAFNGHVEAVRLLLDRDADLTKYAEPEAGFTVLHAALIGMPGLADRAALNEIVELLLERGADPRAKTLKGVSIVEVAKAQGIDGTALIRLQQAESGFLGKQVEESLTKSDHSDDEPVEPVNVDENQTSEATAAPDFSSRVFYVSSRNLNMRAGPSADDKIVDQLGRGALLRTRDEAAVEKWINVDSVIASGDGNLLPGLSGWVNADYLTTEKPTDPVLFGELCVKTSKPYGFVAGRGHEKRNATTNGGGMSCDWISTAQTGRCLALAHDGNSADTSTYMTWDDFSSVEEAFAEVAARCSNRGVSCSVAFLDCLTEAGPEIHLE